jgi:hypothetical protein
LLGNSSSEIKQSFLTDIFRIDKTKENFEKFTFLYPLFKFNAKRFFEILESMFFDLSPKSAWISKPHTRQSVVDFFISVFYDSNIPPFNAWSIGKATSWPTLTDVSTFSIWLIQFVSRKIVNVNIDSVHRIFSSVGYQYQYDKNVITPESVIFFEMTADMFWTELDSKNMIKNTENGGL